MASPSPPPYDDIETFGKEYVNEHYINKIKYILENFHDNIEDKRYYMNALEEEYNEILSNRNVRYEPWQKQDMFNELIEQAKKELEEENRPFRNNPPFDSDVLRGGKSRKHKSRKHKSRKHKSRKHKSRKHKSRKHKRSSK